MLLVLYRQYERDPRVSRKIVYPGKTKLDTQFLKYNQKNLGVLLPEVPSYR